MNVKSIAAGVVLLALASWQFTTNGISLAALLFAGGGLVIVVLGGLGKGIEAEQASGTVDFLTDPGGAIVDAATDRLGNWLSEASEPKQAEFDPDAAIARYLEARPADQAGSAAPGRAPAGFGRKGLPSAES